MYLEDYGLIFIVEVRPDSENAERKTFYTKEDVLKWCHDNKVFEEAEPPRVEKQPNRWKRRHGIPTKVSGGILVWGHTQGDNLRKRRVFREGDLAEVLGGFERKHQIRQEKDGSARRTKRLS